MIYFAYGSNMCLGRLQDRVKSAQFVEIAKIEHYCLKFYKRSPDPGFGPSAKATLVEMENSVVYGGLFDFNNGDVEGLRTAEGYPEHYTENQISVTTLSGVKLAMTYMAHANYYDEGQIPYDWYVDLIRFGGLQIGLPGDYLRQFDLVVTKMDVNAERSKRERAHLK